MTFIITFFLLLGFWITLSGLFDLWHFGLGILSCSCVAYLSGNLFFRKKPTKKKLKEVLKFSKYVPWLLYNVFLANIYVIRLALSAKVEDLIHPHIVKFKTTLKGDLPLATFGNSITLTPGTITIKIEDDIFFVHAIDLKVAEGLPGEMEEKIGKIFGE